ncbi:GNAT family N-acetyltransferase [Aspergillus clavatus NRRL 1]|uniref:GNAT family acetyltransferase, putative n=1 Tax=Aspergillus clavatus (strain ATCC 1007 / CBS 513.65 / DSM 816 / NCTC 3887 / NRRL 1 / QM 1276 / 107) TaxID=344612 RepID=A1CCV9_ASPCL|nr:GNAT family acetyltransferase, putative [Aspergillus clavatus NRRL 1]EAW12366.1 GNAT family acetyltransferase, putative [Aspergillus clavatus NRRL 1]
MTIDNTWSPSPTFSIPTARLHISYFQPENPEHSDFLIRLWNTDDFIQSCGKTGITTPEKASAFLRNRVLADYNRNKYGMFLVSLKPHEGASLAESRLIGTVSLMKGEPPNAYLAPDIGYATLPEESGKGYATEAAIGLLDYARRELDVDGVFGFCSKDDSRSRRVLEKIGLEFRGEKKLKVFGGNESAVYALPSMSQDLKEYGIDD